MAVVAPSSERRVVGNVIRGSIGNLIEWYDWYAYSAFGIYFASVFFPHGDNQTRELFDTAGVFAVGFLMRPIGGYVMGRLADRIGRRNALTFSVVLMAVGSLIITFTPGYATIGWAAPVILLFARLLQGLSVGGEYATSATYLSEVASSGKRGFYSSFQYVTLISGQLIALGVQIVLQQVLTDQELTTWGWRVAFGIGAVGALAVMWLRRSMDESASFTNQEKTPDQGTLKLLFQYPRQVLTVVGLTMGGTVAFYTYTTYLQKFMVNTSHIDKASVTWINFIALAVFMGIQPLYGRLSDRIGRRPLLLFFGIGGTLITVPLLSVLASTRNPVVAFVLMMVALSVVSGYTSINAIVKAELFPTKIRALGVGLPYAVTVAVFGGTAELIAFGLKDAGVEQLFYWYVSACALVSLVVYWRMSETSKSSELNHEGAAGRG